MLTMLGSRRQFCDGITRRETLNVGALSVLGGFGLPQLLQAEQQREHVWNGKARSVNCLYLLGGSPWQDMYDLKPNVNLPRRISDPGNPGVTPRTAMRPVLESPTSFVAPTPAMPLSLRAMKLVVAPLSRCMVQNRIKDFAAPRLMLSTDRRTIVIKPAAELSGEYAGIPSAERRPYGKPVAPPTGVDCSSVSLAAPSELSDRIRKAATGIGFGSAITSVAG